MGQVILIFFVLLLIVLGLEVNKIVPSTILPSLIAIHDLIKANPYILAFITNLKTFIENFEIKSYLDAFDASLLGIYTYVASLPWERLNIWYVIGTIFIIGVISEKFRTLSNEVKFINQKLARIKGEIVTDNSSSNVDLNVNLMENLRSDASTIINLLEDIKKTTDSLKSTELRSKKLRREVMLMFDSNDTETANINEYDQPKEDDLTPEWNSSNQSSSTPNINDDDNHDNEELDISSDDISPLDLARTYIEANENQKAESIIKKVVQTGTEHEKHEAKILFLQLRK